MSVSSLSACQSFHRVFFLFLLSSVGPEVPRCYSTEAVHGFVEELVVNDDPEYKVGPEAVCSMIDCIDHVCGSLEGIGRGLDCGGQLHQCLHRGAWFGRREPGPLPH